MDCCAGYLLASSSVSLLSPHMPADHATAAAWSMGRHDGESSYIDAPSSRHGVWEGGRSTRGAGGTYRSRLPGVRRPPMGVVSPELWQLGGAEVEGGHPAPGFLHPRANPARPRGLTQAQACSRAGGAKVDSSYSILAEG